MTTLIEPDYLVVGAGAAGMAFTDALIDHTDVSVAMVDRRHSAGGHWLDAYPFVRLHQASAFYGVASTLLGGGHVQQSRTRGWAAASGRAAEICAYYDHILPERMLESGKVEFFANCEYVGDRQIVSRVSGQRLEVPQRCRIVDARYLAPDIPADTPPPFDVADGARVIAVNDLVRLAEAPSQYVIVGSGKTATDACVWLLGRWRRPRCDLLGEASRSVDAQPGGGSAGSGGVPRHGWPTSCRPPWRRASLEDLFLRMEAADIMVRVDRSVTPTMAKTPTLAKWELERLRTIEHVVRLGHVRHVERGRITLEGGAVVDRGRRARRALCGVRFEVPAARCRSGGRTAITAQPIRAGFPCFGAALAGYVEAILEDDREKNRLCPPSPYANTPSEWARMQVLGYRSATAFASHPASRRGPARWR